MTLSSTTTKVTYNGDGSTTVFSVGFIFWDITDLRVIHRDSSGMETVWTEGTQYTLTGGGGSTGTLTVETAPADYTPAAGETLTIKDAQSETQGDSLPLSGAFPSTVVEQRLDKLTRLIQNHTEEIARSILLPETASLSGLQLPEPGAGELVRYNAGGTDLETVAFGDISTAIDTLLTGLATNDFLYWDNAQSAWVNIAPGATGLALLQDASAADARTELGLGTAAVVNTGVADGNIPKMDATGYPAADGSQITNLAVFPDASKAPPEMSNGADADHDIDIPAGYCRADNAAAKITNAALTKQLDAPWALGTAAGGNDQAQIDGAETVTFADNGAGEDTVTIDSGTWTYTPVVGDTLVVVGGTNAGSYQVITGTTTVINVLTASFAADAGSASALYVIKAGGTYHQYLIRRSDTGVVDALFSEGASAPDNLPASYDQYRRIGAVKLDATANIRAFLQTGDEFWWDQPTLDLNNQAISAAAITSTVSVPLGVKVRAIFTVFAPSWAAGDALYISDPDTTDMAADTTTAPLSLLSYGGNNTHGSQATQMTNASAQFRIRSNGSNNLYLSIWGWVDPRGRNA
jgi:hypothetical protein